MGIQIKKNCRPWFFVHKQTLCSLFSKQNPSPPLRQTEKHWGSRKTEIIWMSWRSLAVEWRNIYNNKYMILKVLLEDRWPMMTIPLTNMHLCDECISCPSVKCLLHVNNCRSFPCETDCLFRSSFDDLLRFSSCESLGPGRCLDSALQRAPHRRPHPRASLQPLWLPLTLWCQNCVLGGTKNGTWAPVDQGMISNNLV